ncbi:MAG TPA: hypothetical protein VLA34_08360 [Candidatus Krumholzibacterium sp.]|nr:hypothetical protein [Candidatus Krumholzibacterium sp.]
MTSDEIKKESQLSQADKWLNDAIDPSDSDQKRDEEDQKKDEEGNKDERS